MGSRINATMLTAGDFLEAQRKFIIPGFQRGYIWTRKQSQSFLENILTFLNEDADFFIGTFIVNAPSHLLPNQHPQFNIFDGQQRLVTLSFILVSVAVIAKEIGEAEQSKFIHQRYLTLSNLQKNALELKIQLTEADRSEFEEVIASVANNSTLSPQNRFLGTLESIKQAINKYIDQPGEEKGSRLDALLNHVVSHVVFAVVQVSDVKMALQVFEGVNTPGIIRKAIEFGTMPKSDTLMNRARFQKAGELRQIFLSYAREDAPMMARIKQHIAGMGFKVWTDENIEPGTESWKRAIQHAIEQSGSLIILISPDAKQSEWVGREVSYAKLQQVPIFPVFVRGTPSDSISFDLSEYNWVDLRENDQFDSGLNEVLKTIYSKLKRSS
jgi:hypothetical protein